MKGNFNKIVESNIPVLVDFFAVWCGPCKTQAPILVEIAKELEGKVKVVKIDVDKNQEIAARFQIRSVPTLALFKNGKNVWRQSGVLNKSQLREVLKSYL